MKSNPVSRTTLFWAGILSLLIYLPAAAQDMYGIYGDPYSQGLSNQLNAQMQYSQSMINQLLQNYERENSEQLRAKYQYILSQGINMPYERFVYYDLMSSGGQNPQAVINQQRGMVGAMQGANQDLQNTYDDNFRSWQQNQQTMDRIHQQRMHAIQGVGPYYNPGTGQTYMLPYDQSGYYSDGMGNFYSTPDGRYYEEQPGGFWQELEEFLE